MSESYIREVEMLREGERAADAEIERLREALARAERIASLTVAASSVAGEAIRKMDEANAEIERLRGEVKLMRQMDAPTLAAIEKRDAEIERLRGELQAILANGVRVRIPTETMEAEIAAHVRRAVKEKNLEIERLRAELAEKDDYIRTMSRPVGAHSYE